ncbi:MAG: hypothetical protein HY397_03370 [Candidatus Doudnabacteria bacterium]|nr:hypothetical protein [Candidatus Doudnabacteria bacterium]
MKKYLFMWGQKQSAMITQAMLSQLLTDIDSRGRQVASGIPEDLFFQSNGIFSHYMPGHAIKRMESNGKKMLETDFSNTIFRRIEKHIRAFINFSSKIRRSDFSRYDNGRLLKILEVYEDYLNKTFTFFEFSTPAGTTALVNKVGSILKSSIRGSRLRQQYFVWLCTPAEPDETMKERMDFIKLLDKKTVTSAELKKYALKYPALFFNTYNDRLVLSFLKTKFVQESKTDHRQAVLRMRNALVTAKTRHKLVYNQIKNQRLKYLAETIQKNALARYRLKHIWSGAEYMCLPLIQALHKRTQTTFNNFIETYTFTDLKNLLLNDKQLSKREIEQRKMAFAYYYHHGSLTFLSGKPALALKNRLVSKIQIQERIHGSMRGIPANHGLIKGRVRIVNVKDLRQFIKDRQNFRKGEILVTTMTSPIMVPIVEKAAGIITDEGGITSHAAVVAREFNIPCIVGTHGASSILKTGQMVELNADKGIVQLQKK